MRALTAKALGAAATAGFLGSPRVLLWVLFLIHDWGVQTQGNELSAREVIAQTKAKLEAIRTIEATVELRNSPEGPGFDQKILLDKDTGCLRIDELIGRPKVPRVHMYDGDTLWFMVLNACWYGPLPRHASLLSMYREYTGAEPPSWIEWAKLLRSEILNGRPHYVLECRPENAIRPKDGTLDPAVASLIFGTFVLWIDAESGIVTQDEHRKADGRLVRKRILKEFRVNPHLDASKFRPPEEVKPHAVRLSTQEIGDRAKLSRLFAETLKNHYSQQKQKRDTQ